MPSRRTMKPNSLSDLSSHWIVILNSVFVPFHEQKKSYFFRLGGLSGCGAVVDVAEAVGGALVLDGGAIVVGVFAGMRVLAPSVFAAETVCAARVPAWDSRDKPSDAGAVGKLQALKLRARTRLHIQLILNLFTGKLPEELCVLIRRSRWMQLRQFRLQRYL